jgi:hypothetical protein
VTVFLAAPAGELGRYAAGVFAMSIICRVVIGYFDGAAACKGGRIVVTKRLDDQLVADLQAACDELFAIETRLRDNLAPDGLLWYNQEMIIRPDIYKAACVGHTLFDMTAIDHAHRYVMFPAVEPELPSVEKMLEVFEALKLNIPQQDRRAKAE